MSKAPKTVEQFVAQLDALAANSGNAAAYWQTAGLCMAIWTSGGVPAAAWDPRLHSNLMPGFKALQKFGRPLVDAINTRAFASVGA